MDVRCEKCETEYELDESKVTEAGVTVKCTSCGNLFKIRRRATTQQPLPPMEAGPNEKVWLVRSPAGDLRKFRELTQLQPWIIERRVSRDCEISRTGEAWTRLGDIGELSSFFAVVEQASAALKAQAVSRGKSTLSVQPPNVPPAGSQGTTGSRPVQPGPQNQAPTMLGAQLSTPAFLSVAAPDEVHGGRGADSLYRPAQAAPASQASGSPPPLDLETARATADSGEPVWAGQPLGGKRIQLPSGAPVSAKWKAQPGSAYDDGPEMAISTNRRPSRVAPATEPDGYGRIRPASDTFDPDAVLDEIGAHRSRTPHIIAAIILCGGALFAIWWFGLRERPVAAVMQPDAGVAVVKPTVTPMVVGADAGPAQAATVPTPASAPAGADNDKPYRDAIAKLYDDTDESLAAADKLLETAHVANPAAEAKVLAAQALVASSRAQALTDDADAATDPRLGAEAKAEAGRQLTRADKLAHEALAKAAAAPEALIAMADVERQKKVSAAEIEKQLAPAGDRAEALYERGMLRWRDGKGAEAEAFFTRAVDAQAHEMPGTTHLRARYRLAVLSLAAKHYDSAKAQLDAILAAQPAHARAKALAARVALAQAGGQPLQPTQPSGPAQPPPPSPIPGTDLNGGKPTAAEPGTPNPPSNGPGAAADYSGQVAKANKLAENGDCNGAIKMFEKALDSRPSGVEALTGLGYCFLDKKKLPEALSSFRAALGISPRYAEALLGMGDTYRGEGMKAEAADFYKRYLEVDPQGARATTARRFIEEFEGTTGEPMNEDNAPPPPKPTKAAPQAAPQDKPRDGRAAAVRTNCPISRPTTSQPIRPPNPPVPNEVFHEHQQAQRIRRRVLRPRGGRQAPADRPRQGPPDGGG